MGNLYLDGTLFHFAACHQLGIRFSGAGSLAARMVNYAPERTIAAIEYAAGRGGPVGTDTVTLSGAFVPQASYARRCDSPPCSGLATSLDGSPPVCFAQRTGILCGQVPTGMERP
jgi:hypothetical protein